MIIVCPSCQARYKFDEAKLGDRPKVKTRCAKCGGTIEIENPLLGAMTLPPAMRPRPAPPPAARYRRRAPTSHPASDGRPCAAASPRAARGHDHRERPAQDGAASSCRRTSASPWP